MTAPAGYLNGNAADRASKIAALHAFAEWLAEHPEAPIPTGVVATYHVTAHEEADEYTRIMGVLSIMQRVGISPSEGDLTVQGDLDLCTQAMHGISVIYRVAAHKDRRPERRYVP